MVKLNAFRTQWRKNMKRKVVVDVIYVQFDNYACARVNDNNVLSEDLKMNESLFYGEKCLFLLLLI